MRSKLLNYYRPGKNARAVQNTPDGRDEEMAADPAFAAAPAATPIIATVAMPSAVASAVPSAVPTAARQGPLDFPSVKNWLRFCEDDFERGRNKHEYTALSPVFASNGCTRIDDVARLSVETIKSLAEKEGVSVSIGLANRIHQYAADDVARVKAEGKLYAMTF